jgi:hypothetical protein
MRTNPIRTLALVNQKPPHGGFFLGPDSVASGGRLSRARLAPIRHEADACEAEDHHRPGGGLRAAAVMLSEPVKFSVSRP